MYTWRMEKLPVSRENARTIIRLALRRGPVYVFDDEADTAAKESVRALLSHWPDLFQDAVKHEDPARIPGASA